MELYGKNVVVISHINLILLPHCLKRVNAGESTRSRILRDSRLQARQRINLTRNGCAGQELIIDFPSRIRFNDYKTEMLCWKWGTPL